MDENNTYETNSKKTGYFISRLLLFVFCVLISYFFYLVFLKTNNINSVKYFEIKKGESVNTIGLNLKKENLIDNQKIFYYSSRVLGLGGFVYGEYSFNKNETIYSIIKRLSTGDYGYTPIKIVVPEGFTNKQIMGLCIKYLPKCDQMEFMKLTENKEGYLFPATYILSPNTNTEKFVNKMLDNYTKRTFDIKNKLQQNILREYELLILASIIEREAGNDEEKPIIAGILLARLSDNVALQVDAPFYYLFQKKSSDLTINDLRTPSPYNTYINKGLPPTPIGNPGIVSIKSTIEPIKTDYYFYLHGRDGAIHYAKNYQEHLSNKRKYLN